MSGDWRVVIDGWSWVGGVWWMALGRADVQPTTSMMSRGLPSAVEPAEQDVGHRVLILFGRSGRDSDLVGESIGDDYGVAVFHESSWMWRLGCGACARCLGVVRASGDRDSGVDTRLAVTERAELPPASVARWNAVMNYGSKVLCQKTKTDEQKHTNSGSVPDWTFLGCSHGRAAPKCGVPGV